MMKVKLLALRGCAPVSLYGGEGGGEREVVVCWSRRRTIRDLHVMGDKADERECFAIM